MIFYLLITVLSHFPSIMEIKATGGFPSFLSGLDQHIVWLQTMPNKRIGEVVAMWYKSLVQELPYSWYMSLVMKMASRAAFSHVTL